MFTFTPIRFRSLQRQQRDLSRSPHFFLLTASLWNYSEQATYMWWPNFK